MTCVSDSIVMSVMKNWSAYRAVACGVRAKRNILKTGDIWMHLPHEIVEGECRSCNVEQCVERVRKVIQ